MSELHIDFGDDHLPASERQNEHASTPPDWEGILQNLDGELDGLRQDLGEEQFEKLREAVVLIFAWVLKTKDTGCHGYDSSTGRRFLSLAMVLTPGIVGMDRVELGNVTEVSKQALSDQIAEARRFLRGLRVKG